MKLWQSVILLLLLFGIVILIGFAILHTIYFAKLQNTIVSVQQKVEPFLQASVCEVCSFCQTALGKTVCSPQWTQQVCSFCTGQQE